MCNPMAILMAVQTAAQISATNKQAETAQKAAIDTQYAMNAQRVAEMEDTNRKSSLELTEAKREAVRQQGIVRAAGAGSGVSGVTSFRNLANVYLQESLYAGTVISKSESQHVMNAVSSQSDYISTKNTLNEAESKKSTGLNAALQIGISAGAGYYGGGGAEKGATFSGQWEKTLDIFRPKT